MKVSKPLLLSIIAALVIVFFSVVFSHHGLLDRQHFAEQISQTQRRIQIIEEENRRLKHQVDLLDGSTSEVIERQVRALLGWAKSDELVYFEKSKKPF